MLKRDTKTVAAHSTHVHTQRGSRSCSVVLEPPGSLNVRLDCVAPTHSHSCVHPSRIDEDYFSHPGVEGAGLICEYADG